MIKIEHTPVIMVSITLFLITGMFLGFNTSHLYPYLSEIMGYSILADIFFIKYSKSIVQKAAAWALLYNNIFNLAYRVFGFDKTDYTSAYANVTILSVGFIFTFYLLNKKHNDHAKRG